MKCCNVVFLVFVLWVYVCSYVVSLFHYFYRYLMLLLLVYGLFLRSKKMFLWFGVGKSVYFVACLGVR